MRRQLVGAVRVHDPTRGFTLVELVLVIAILAVLAAVAGPRFFGQQPFVERGYTDELAAALRYAGKVAVATGCPVRVTIDAGGYAAQQQAESGNRCDPTDGKWPVAVMLPDGSAVAGTLPAGLAVEPSGEYLFDAQGRLSASPGKALQVGDRRIDIDADTGFVTVQ